MTYVKTNWVNDNPPAINAANLNKIEQGIYEAHQMAGGEVIISTTEHETNEKRNNKKVYIKEYIISNPTPNIETTISLNLQNIELMWLDISNSYVEIIDNDEGHSYKVSSLLSDRIDYISLVYYDEDHSINSPTMHLDAKNIYSGNYEFHIVIKYTKVSD